MGEKPGSVLHESPMITSTDQKRRIAPVEYCNMRIFLAGVGCVGKSTVGAKLADLLDYRFFDLDVEIERFFEISIERLRNSCLTPHSFRLAASQALKQVLSREDSCNCVIALPPSGLMGGYWKVVNKTQDAAIVVLRDAPENTVAVGFSSCT
jgi:shikimate kinase